MHSRLAVSGWFTVAGLDQMSPVCWGKSVETVNRRLRPEVKLTMGKTPNLSRPPSCSQCDLWIPEKLMPVFVTDTHKSSTRARAHTFKIFTNWELYNPSPLKVKVTLILNSKSFADMHLFVSGKNRTWPCWKVKLITFHHHQPVFLP